MNNKNNIVFNAAVTTGIVCRPNCPPGRRTKLENRKYFSSLNDAYDEGFRDCLVCKPSKGPPGPWISKSKKTDYE